MSPPPTFARRLSMAAAEEDQATTIINQLKLATFDSAGQAYFQELVHTLVERLGVAVAFVGQLVEEVDDGKALPRLDWGRSDDDGTGRMPKMAEGDVGFSLIASFTQKRQRNTSATVFPISKVLFQHLSKGEAINIPSHLADVVPAPAMKAFPDARLDSCCLIALKDPSNHTIGVLGIGSPKSQPSPTASFHGQVLQSLHARTASELRCSTELHYLKVTTHAAQAATKSKTHFLANMSHEIRTPVSAIIGLTDMLLWDPMDLKEEQRNKVELINSSGEHLLAVINDILDLSKIGDEDLKFALQERPLSLRRCLREAVHLASMSPSVAKKRVVVIEGEEEPKEEVDGLPLYWHVDPDVPDTIVADSTRLRQIIMNLLSNACKFTIKGSVRLNVSRLPNSPVADPLYPVLSISDDMPIPTSEIFEGVHIPTPPSTSRRGSRVLSSSPSHSAIAQLSGERANLLFTVTDTGVGIPRSKINRLFIPFSQIDNAVTRGSGVGTGLGLAISSRLVQMMGGHIWVESSEGVGSKFAFCAPFQLCNTPPQTPSPHQHTLANSYICSKAVSPPPEAPQPTSSTRAARNARINEKLASLYPIRILVAEDNPINQQIALSVLKKMGYTADVAWNGQEVLQKIVDEKKQYDLILMDICMPHLDGLATTRELVGRGVTKRNGEIQSADEEEGLIIIALTASATTEDRARCEQAGMHDWLAKPFKAGELQEKVERWFGWMANRRTENGKDPNGKENGSSAADPESSCAARAAEVTLPNCTQTVVATADKSNGTVMATPVPTSQPINSVLPIQEVIDAVVGGIKLEERLFGREREIGGESVEPAAV